MFTGIVKAIGRIDAIERRGGDLAMTIVAADLPWDDCALGDSIAVNGVCLTAVAFCADGFVTDVSAETLEVTTLGTLAVGAAVNLETALALGERLGGHLVTGHVDCKGIVRSAGNAARSLQLSVEVPAEFGRYIARKGSVCVDGVSLTINQVSGNRFELNIIPHTAEVTTIGRLAVGCEVNIEVDLLARYLERLVSGDDGGLSLDFLKAHGYAR